VLLQQHCKSFHIAVKKLKAYINILYLVVLHIGPDIYYPLILKPKNYFRMKFLQKIFATILLISMVQCAHAQYCGNSGPSVCTAGNNLTQPGFSPPSDSVPCAIQGVAYSQVVQVKVPTTVMYNGSSYTLNRIKIDTISNLPCGLCWATENANNTFNGGSQFCIRITGTTYDNPGQFKLHIIVDATVLGGLITQTVDAGTAGLTFYSRVQTPTGVCAPVDTTQPGNTASPSGAAPSGVVAASGPLSFCQGGSVTFTATQTGAQYQWYNAGTAIANATGRTYTTSSAGTYTVAVIANCQRVVSAIQTVTINAPPTASVSPAGPVIICGGSSQLLTATVSGGTTQWYNGTTILTGSTGTTYTATASGNYYVVATQNGCADTSNKVNIQVTGTPPTPIVTATRASVCAGALDTLDAGAGYSSYAWSSGLGTGRKAYPTGPGTYTVTVTNGVCSGTGSITIGTIAPTPIPTITPNGTVTICQGTTATLISSVANSYLWSNNATTRSITVSTAGSFSVTTNNGCGAATSAAVTVAVTARPNGVVTPAGPIVLCGSGTQVLTASGGSSYQWLKNNAIINGQTLTTYTVTTTGNYSCIVTQNGCIDTSNVVNVQITSTTLTPVITAVRSFVCPSGADTLDVGTGYSSYVWSPGGATVHSISITASGTYTVTVHNGGCSGTAFINIVSRVANTTPQITALGATSFCQGGSVILVSTRDSSYLWNSAGGTRDSTTVSASGSYTVTTNSGCGAATSAPTTVTVNPIPVASITPAGSTLLCGGSSQTLTATPAGGSYVWIESGSILAGQTLDSIHASTSGTYRAIVTVNGCSDSSNTATIQVSGTPPTPVITATSTLLCPGAAPDTLNVGTGYSSYSWGGGLGTTSTIIVNTSGTYTVTVANGVCVGSASITVNQGLATLPPTISVTGSLHICGNDSVILTSSTGANSTWSNGSTGASITEYNPGIFTVTTSGTCGSATSAPDSVTQGTIPSVSLGPDTGGCAGTIIVLTAHSTATSFVWSTGASTSNTNSITTAGQYSVTATQYGCSSADTINVTFDTAPTASFTNNNGILTAAVGGMSYQWLLNSSPVSGATANTLDVNTTGTVGASANYAVVVSNGFCFATSAAQLITITGLSDISQSLTTRIYPNPTNKQVTVSYTLIKDESLEITLTDLTGRTISQLYSGHQSGGTYEIGADISTLTGGIYLVSFKTAEGTLVRKIIKE
jgi:hypothetical protein